MMVLMYANKNDLVERGEMMAVKKRQNYQSNVWVSLKEWDIVLKQGSVEFMWECGLITEGKAERIGADEGRWGDVTVNVCVEVLF